MLRRNLISELKPKALLFIKKATTAVAIGDVAKNVNVSWSTARQILMELTLENKVECEITTNAKIFRPKAHKN
jgi:predicted ArsR family transcriptional regulator